MSSIQPTKTPPHSGAAGQRASSATPSRRQPLEVMTTAPRAKSAQPRPPQPLTSASRDACGPAAVPPHPGHVMLSNRHVIAGEATPGPTTPTSLSRRASGHSLAEYRAGTFGDAEVANVAQAQVVIDEKEPAALPKSKEGGTRTPTQRAKTGRGEPPSAEATLGSGPGDSGAQMPAATSASPSPSPNENAPGQVDEPQHLATAVAARGGGAGKAAETRTEETPPGSSDSTGSTTLAGVAPAAPATAAVATPIDYRRAARAVMLGATLATGYMGGVAVLSAKFLLRLGVPTPTTACLVGVAFLISTIFEKHAWQPPVQQALCGVFLSVQVAGFSTAALTSVAMVCGSGVLIGLLPTLLMTAPKRLDAVYQAGVKLQGAMSRMREWLGMGLITPSVATVTLYLLKAWTLSLPLLYIVAHAMHTLLLQSKAKELLETITERNEERVAGQHSRDTLNEFVTDVGYAFKESSVRIGLLGVSAGCIVATPWDYWKKAMRNARPDLFSFGRKYNLGHAHESAPMAFATPSTRLA